MSRKTHALLALIPAMALGYSACVVEPSTIDEEVVVEEESEIVAPNPALIGTFRNQEFRPGALAMLVLKSDGTYHRGTVVACVTAPCIPPQDDGQYMLWVRGGQTYLSLVPDDGGTAERYQYTLRGDAMRIARLGERGWMSLQKTENAAWCGEPMDCTLQNLPVGPCANEWHCMSNICSYSCQPPILDE